MANATETKIANAINLTSDEEQLLQAIRSNTNCFVAADGGQIHLIERPEDHVGWKPPESGRKIILTVQSDTASSLFSKAVILGRTKLDNLSDDQIRPAMRINKAFQTNFNHHWFAFEKALGQIVRLYKGDRRNIS